MLSIVLCIIVCIRSNVGIYWEKQDMEDGTPKIQCRRHATNNLMQFHVMTCKDWQATGKGTIAGDDNAIAMQQRFFEVIGCKLAPKEVIATSKEAEFAQKITTTRNVLGVLVYGISTSKSGLGGFHVTTLTKLDNGQWWYLDSHSNPEVGRGLSAVVTAFRAKEQLWSQRVWLDSEDPGTTSIKLPKKFTSDRSGQETVPNGYKMTAFLKLLDKLVVGKTGKSSCGYGLVTSPSSRATLKTKYEDRAKLMAAIKTFDKKSLTAHDEYAPIYHGYGYGYEEEQQNSKQFSGLSAPTYESNTYGVSAMYWVVLMGLCAFVCCGLMFAVNLVGCVCGYTFAVYSNASVKGSEMDVDSVV